MSDPEQGWRWWAYVAGRCLANLPRAIRHPRPVVDALINLEREAAWPPEIRGAGPGSLTLAERLFLRWLCASRPLATAFEFGTGRGYTATLLAECGLTVHTLSLPGEVFCCFPNVVALSGDSTTFDFSSYQGAMDLVFVDGGHDAATVMSDTAAAYVMRAPRGVIVWHDCNIQHRDVWRVLCALRKDRPIVWVEGTHLAVDFGALYTGLLP